MTLPTRASNRHDRTELHLRTQLLDMTPFSTCMHTSSVFRDLVCLQALQRYYSYRAVHVAIVLQNSLVFVFVGHRTIMA